MWKSQISPQALRGETDSMHCWVYRFKNHTHRTSTSGLLCLSTTCEEKFSRQRAACRVARTALRYGRRVAVWGRKVRKSRWDSVLKKNVWIYRQAELRPTCEKLCGSTHFKYALFPSFTSPENFLQNKDIGCLEFRPRVGFWLFPLGHDTTSNSS